MMHLVIGEQVIEPSGCKAKKKYAKISVRWLAPLPTVTPSRRSTGTLRCRSQSQGHEEHSVSIKRYQYI